MNNGGLHGGQAGKNQIEKDKRRMIVGLPENHGGIDPHPNHEEQSGLLFMMLSTMEAWISPFKDLLGTLSSK